MGKTCSLALLAITWVKEAGKITQDFSTLYLCITYEMTLFKINSSNYLRFYQIVIPIICSFVVYFYALLCIYFKFMIRSQEKNKTEVFEDVNQEDQTRGLVNQ